MALIGMAIYSTEENGKDEYLAKTLKSLFKTVNFDKHRLMLSINAKTSQTDHLIKIYQDIISKIFYNDTNLGTAEAINLIWRERMPGEHAVKMDDDIVIHEIGWLDQLEHVANTVPQIGQIGLKRKDCIESPSNTNAFYKTELKFINVPGSKWVIAEFASHIMGSCVLHSDRLLNKVGYLYQLGKYGFDDSFMSFRSKKAGFLNAFLPHIEIDHIDPGQTPYQKWKEAEAGSRWTAYHQTIQGYHSGTKSIYYNPFENK